MSLFNRQFAGLSETEKNKLIFEDLPVPQALRSMAIPTIIGQMIILIYNMADTFFIGRVNNPLMVAGAALVLPLYNISIAFANISGTGGGTLIARLLGRGRPDEARRVACFSFYFAVFAGAVFALVVGLFMEPMLYALGASQDTIVFAEKYCLCVIVIGGIPTVLSITLSNLLRNAGRSREAGIGMSMGGIINIILDPLFMFVILEPGNENLGAGLATALSNVISLIYYAFVIKGLNSEILNFSPGNGLPGRDSISSFFAVGAPAAVGPLLFDVDYMVLNRLVSSYGDIPLAAMGIVLKVERIPQNVGIGLCLGMTPLAAYNFSSGNHSRVRSVLKCARRTGIIIGLCAIALYELFAPYVLRFFIEDAETVAIGASFLRIRALATVLMFMCFIYVHFFQALGKGRVSLLLACLRWLCLNIPVMFILNRLIGLFGVPVSAVVADGLMALLSYIIFRRETGRLLKPDVPQAQ